MSRAAAKFEPFAFATDLWRHRGLLWQFAHREVELRHKGSYLGFVWSLLNPLLILSLYVCVFGYIFNGSYGVLPHETRIDYVLALFLGLTIFQFLAEIIALTPNLISANQNLVKKVVFPLEILPAASVFAAGFHLLISLGLVMLGVTIFGSGLTLGTLWLPLLILPLMLQALGVAWIIAAFGVFLRDLSQVTAFFSLALMYASAIFYPPSKISPELWQFLRFNPLLLDVELARNAVLWERALNFRHLAYLYLVGISICYAGHRIFRRLKPAFADVL